MYPECKTMTMHAFSRIACLVLAFLYKRKYEYRKCRNQKLEKSNADKPTVKQYFSFQCIHLNQKRLFHTFSPLLIPFVSTNLYGDKRCDRQMPDYTLLPFPIFFCLKSFSYLIYLFQQLVYHQSKSPIAYINLH